MHLFGRPARVDHGAAFRFFRRDGEEAGAQPIVKGALLPFEAVVAAARSRPGEAELDRKVEDQREIRPEIAGDEAVERVELGARDAAGAALVGDRRISEPVRDDPLSRGERWPDRAPEVVPPRSADEKRLGDRVPAPGIAADEEPADLLRARRAAGLARGDRVYAGTVERLDEEPDLGRLAGALPAFEGDEAPSQFSAPNMR